MSWKIYLIIISNSSNVNTNEIPAKIGFPNLKPLREVSMSKAQYISSICIGKYDDKIFIVSDDLVFKFYEKNISEFERKICDSFPNSEIAVLTLYGTVDLYGYCIINNGKRQRVKSGSDLELYIDEGDKLQEEIEISKEKIFTDQELIEMRSEYLKEQFDMMIDQEISIRTTFRLTKRYFREEIDKSGSDYEKITLIQFQ